MKHTNGTTPKHKTSDVNFKWPSKKERIRNMRDGNITLYQIDIERLKAALKSLSPQIA